MLVSAVRQTDSVTFQHIDTHPCTHTYIYVHFFLKLFLFIGLSQAVEHSSLWCTCCLSILHILCCYLVAQSCDSLWPRGLQHARLPSPVPSPGTRSNACPLSRWCHPPISSSVIPFSSCPHSFPASGSFPVSRSSHQVAKVLEFQLQHQSCEYSGLISFRMGWLDLLAVQGTLKSLQHHSSKASVLWCSAFFMVQFSHPHMTTGKT